MKPERQPASACFETKDTSEARFDATDLILGKGSRDPQSQAARLGRQFIAQNGRTLAGFGVEAELVYYGVKVSIQFRTSTTVGALPLVSPATGRPDFGLIIHPRLEWQGVGEMLGAMGWRVIPEVVRLPMLPRTARNIPAWVLSAIVIPRLEALLRQLQRRFEFTEAELNAPRGSVQWGTYAQRQMPKMQFLRVPCRFPELRDDHDLRAAVHFTLRQQFSSLETQRSAGFFVVRLIERCLGLIDLVSEVAPKPPTPLQMTTWLRGPLPTESFRDGIQAVGWTVEQRGLAGLSELQGLPWRMSMEEFFEAWVETIANEVAPRIGAIARVGRKRETVFPISWERPYLGSQKSLVPDLVLHRGDETIIIDAKYKEHWEDLQVERWVNMAEEIRTRHREDLMQVLAYSSLFETRKVTACLAYPCRRAVWEALRQSKAIHRRASIHSGERQVNIVLTTVPMVARVEEVREVLEEAVATSHNV
jgi:hypothetical protein